MKTSSWLAVSGFALGQPPILSVASTGASSSYQSMGSATLPYWIKLARSGNVFSMYGSSDGVNWVQLGTSQTVSMAQNVYVGLAVSSRNSSALVTASFDNISATSSAAVPH